MAGPATAVDATPSWCVWPSRRRCWASPRRRAGCASPAPTWARCSRTCPSGRATTSGCEPRCRWSSEAIRLLARDTDFWFDNHWIVDSTPVPVRDVAADGQALGPGRLGRIRVLRLTLAVLLGPAAVPGLHPDRACRSPGPWPTRRSDEREVLAAMLDREPHLVADRPGLLLIADKGFASKEFETDLALPGHRVAAAVLQAGEAPHRRVPAEVGTAVDRVGQRHPQGPARPGTARRADLRGRRRPRRPAHPRDGRGDLAQPQDRRTRHCGH